MHYARYFTSPGCGVCHSLKPQLAALFARKFPELNWEVVDVAESPDKAASYQVFTVPVLVIEVDGKPFLRFVRNFSLHEVEEKVERLYNLRFAQ